MELEWSLLFPALAGIGAVVTAVATVLKLYFFPWRDEQRRRRLAKRKALEGKRNLVQSIAHQLQDSVEKRVQSNGFGQGANVGWFVAEFENRIKEYHKRFELCRDLLDACKAVIRLEIERITKGLPPGLASKHSLCESLQADPLIDMYVMGQNVTLAYIAENYPSLHKDIEGYIKESKMESMVNTLLYEINLTFRSNNVLRRFRQEKTELMEFTRSLMKDLEEAIKKIDNELQEYYGECEETEKTS